MKYYCKLDFLVRMLMLKGEEEEAAKVNKAAENYLKFITCGVVNKSELLKVLDEIDKKYALVI